MPSYPTYKLGDVAEILDSFRKPINSTERAKRIQGKNENELYPYYGATGQVGFIDEYLTDGEYVLVGEDGAPFLEPFKNKSYIIKGKAWVNNHAHIISGKKGVSYNQYLNYYLNSFDYKDYVNGTTRLKLTQGNLVEIPIPLPPLPTQQAIVTRIETLFAELDKAVQHLRTAQQQLKTYRQAVLKAAFEGKETNVVRLEEITSDIRIGPFGTMLHKEDYIIGGIPVINPQHIKNGKIVPNNSISISAEKISELSAYRLKSNDVIMGRRGEMGRCAAITEKENGWLCGTGSIMFRLKDEFDAVFYAKILSSPNVVHYLEEKATGTTMKNLNEEIVKSIPVPYITKKIQTAINKSIESRLSVCESTEKTINQCHAQAEALRQSILKKAFSGELVTDSIDN